MSPWVGSRAPSSARQLWGLPNRMEYLSPQGVFAPASLRYNRITPVARVAAPRCLAGDPLLGCVPAHLSLVASMALGDICPGPGCSLAGLGPVALEYRSCHWPGGSAGSPQCVRPSGYRPLHPLPLLPSVHVRVRLPGPLGALLFVHRCGRCVRFACAVGGCVPPPTPKIFFCSVFVFVSPPFFCLKIEEEARAHCRHRHGQLVQRCGSVAFSGVGRRCFVGGRNPGARLAHLDVHGCGSGGVWLVVSSRFGAGWLGGRVGCGCPLWLMCTLSGLG